MNQLSFRLAMTGGLGPIVSTLSLAAIATVVSALPAYGAQLIRWQFDPQTRQLEITTTEGTQPNYFILAQPPRIVVDLPETTSGAVPVEQRYDGAVRQIRVSQFQPNLTRVVIELDPDVEFAAQQVQLRALNAQSSRWVVQPLLAGEQPSPIAAITQPAPEAAPVAALAILQNRTPLDPDADPSEFDPPEPDAIATAMPPLEPGALEIAVDSDMSPTEDAIAADRISLPEPEVTTEPDVDVETEAEVEPVAVESEDETAVVSEREAEVLSETESDAETEADAAIPEPEEGAEEDVVEEDVAELEPETEPEAKPEADSEADSEDDRETAIAAGLVTSGEETLDSTPGPSAERPTAVDNPVALAIIDASPSVLLPAGTVLQLRYPRSIALGLSTGESQQEVLLTTQVIQDQQGITLLPAGTQIIGRFESEENEGRFVAQALVTPDGNRLLSGVTVLKGDQSLQITPNQTVELRIDADLLR